VSLFVLQCEYNEDCFNERILIKFRIGGKFVDPPNFTGDVFIVTARCKARVNVTNYPSTFSEYNQQDETFRNLFTSVRRSYLLLAWTRYSIPYRPAADNSNGLPNA